MKRLHITIALLLAAASGCREEGTRLTEGQSHPRSRDRGAWEAVPTPEGGAQRIAGPSFARKEGTPEPAAPALPKPETATPGPRVWHASCGDPACGRWRDKGLPRCRADAKPGAPCGEGEGPCDPMSLCNQVLVCSDTDPTLGGCPISRASTKRAIRYIGPEDLARYRDELLHMRLATWRYAHDPDRERLGFLIDDDEESVAVDAPGERVDLYGYTSLAVATVQAQAREIEDLKRRIAMIEAQLAIGPSRPGR